MCRSCVGIVYINECIDFAMAERNADFDLDAVDEDFRNTVEFLVDILSHDAMMNGILHEFQDSIPDLAAEIMERLLRIGLSDPGDYACVMTASILASHAEEMQMKSS